MRGSIKKYFEEIGYVSKKKLKAALLIVLILTLPVSTGCTIFDVSSEIEEKHSETAESDDNTVVLKLGIYPWSGSDEEKFKQHDEYINHLTQNNPNIKVEKTPYIYSNDTFIPLVASGKCPTIFETWYMETDKLIKGGYVRDITDILEKRGWLESMNNSFREHVTDDEGRIYGVPHDGYVMGLMVNIDMFKAAGLVDGNGVPKYPKTWEELAEDARLIKKATGQAGFCFPAGNVVAGWQFLNIAWGFGASFFTYNDDGTFTTSIASEEAISAMEFLKSLKWDYDVLTEDPLNDEWDAGFDHIANGTVAMYMAANDAVNQPVLKGLASDKFSIGPMPAGPSGAYSLTGSTVYMFAKDATDEEVNAALDYLVLMGKSPVATDKIKQEIMENARINNEQGIPVIRSFTGWDNSSELDAAWAEAIEKYGNVNQGLYTEYYDFIRNGNVRDEEIVTDNTTYAMLTMVIQKVLADKNADVAEIMKSADKEYQESIEAYKMGWLR
ncbi:MAG: extracellular solute-binding protein [Lachnospiraceae bacterium]|nr:extracellular solute-binding protein [Lachnospiraceae bacterium]